MLLNIDNCCLLIIDLQEKLLPHIFNKEKIKDNSKKLVDLFDDLNLPIIYTEQYPKGLGFTIKCLKQKLIDNKSKKIEKTTFSAFENEELKTHMTQINKNQVIVIGVESHICVLQTTIDCGLLFVTSILESNPIINVAVLPVPECDCTTISFPSLIGLIAIL